MTCGERTTKNGGASMVGLVVNLGASPGGEKFGKSLKWRVKNKVKESRLSLEKNEENAGGFV